MARINEFNKNYEQPDVKFCMSSLANTLQEIVTLFERQIVACDCVNTIRISKKKFFVNSKYKSKVDKVIRDLVANSGLLVAFFSLRRLTCCQGVAAALLAGQQSTAEALKRYQDLRKDQAKQLAQNVGVEAAQAIMPGVTISDSTPDKEAPSSPRSSKGKSIMIPIASKKVDTELTASRTPAPLTFVSPSGPAVTTNHQEVNNDPEQLFNKGHCFLHGLGESKDAEKAFACFLVNLSNM